MVSKNRSTSPFRKIAEPKLWEPDTAPRSRTENQTKFGIDINLLKKKPQHVMGDFDYVRKANKAREEIGNVFLKHTKKKLLLFGDSKEVNDPSEIESHIRGLSTEIFKEWDFSKFEQTLLEDSLHQLKHFVELLKDKLSICHSLQDLFNFYLAFYRHHNKGSVICDIGFLFYLCNYHTEESKISELMNKTLISLPKPDFKFKTILEYSDKTEVIVEDGLNIASKNPDLRIVLASTVPFENFNAKQRERMFYEKRTFAVLKNRIGSSQHEAHENGDVHKNLLNYCICPHFRNDNDVSDFISNTQKWLKIPVKIYCPIISNIDLFPYLHLTPNDRLEYAVEIVMGKYHMDCYRFLECCDLSESYLNYKQLTIVPKSPLDSADFERYSNCTIIPIEHLFVHDRDLFNKVIRIHPNLGTDLWVFFDSGKMKSILIHFGLFLGWFRFCFIKNSAKLDGNDLTRMVSEYKEDKPGSMVMSYVNFTKKEMGDILKSSKQSEALSSLKSKVGVNKIYLDPTTHLFFCDYPDHLELKDCSFVNYKIQM